MLGALLESQSESTRTYMTRGYQLNRANAGNHSTSEVWDAGIALVDAREDGYLRLPPLT